jgi:DNA polymerase-3 subunit beta
MEAVSTAIRAVSAKSTYPALEGLLLTAGEAGLSVCGYNLEIGITATLDASVSEPGQTVLSAKYFSDIIRKLPDEKVFFTVGDNNDAAIMSGMSQFNLISMPAIEFPELPKAESDKTLTLTSGVLKSLINGTAFATAVSETKPLLAGVLFDVGDNVLKVAATDNARLAVRIEQLNLIDEHIPFKFIVPGSTLREIERIIRDDDTDVTLRLSRKHLTMSYGGVTLISRLLEGEFYRYENAMSTVCAYKKTVNTAAFMQSVDRVSLLINEKLRNAVRCKFDVDGIKLTYVSSIGRAYDECPCEGDCADVEIGLSNRFLLEALGAVEDEDCLVEFSAPHSPVVIRPAEGNKFFYMIAAVRI